MEEVIHQKLAESLDNGFIVAFHSFTIQGMLSTWTCESS